MKCLIDHWRLVAWPLALMLVGVAVAIAAKNPDDTSYWLSLLLVVPAGALGIMEMEQRWPSLSNHSRLLITAAVVALALAGGAWNVLTPGPRSYIIGGIMCLPLWTLLVPLLTRDDDYTGASEGPYGPPPF